MAIVSLLIALLLPTLQQARFNAYRIACASQERQMLMSMNLYALDADGLIGKPDFGRKTGDWRDIQSVISNSRPLGPTPADFVGGPNPGNLSIFNHGSWLINAYLPTTDMMYCPGVDYQTTSRTLAQWKDLVNNYLPYYYSGGMQGPKPTDTIVITSYNLNRNLIIPGDANLGGASLFWKGADPNGAGIDNLPYLKGWRVEAMEGWFPVFADVRGGCGVITLGHHASQGWNIARADGAVRWTSADEVIEAGKAVPSVAVQTAFHQYAQQPLPAIPGDTHVSKRYLFNEKTTDVQFEAMARALRD